MTVPIALDERPRCLSMGEYIDQTVPCDLHRGHEGLHEWTSPMIGSVTVTWETGVLNDDMTLAEAKDWLDAQVDKGIECPLCGQHAKVYRRTINPGMARSLVRMYRLAGTDYLDITKHIPAKSREEGKLRYWGLVEAGGRRGEWRVTDKGVDWLMLRITVPRYCNVYDSGAMNFAGDQISFRDIIKVSDADYREMVGV